MNLVTWGMSDVRKQGAWGMFDTETCARYEVELRHGNIPSLRTNDQNCSWDCSFCTIYLLGMWPIP